MAPASPPRAVLVVEDEDPLRMVMVDALRDRGFTVASARNADVAFALLEDRSDIGVLVTDLRLAGHVDGRELATVVRRRWPAIRILVTSGNLRQVEDRLPDDSALLPKPFDFDEFVAAVRRLAR